MFRFAGFELDGRRDELRGPDGRTIKLRPKTFQMLKLFVAHPDQVLSKQDLMDAVWPGVHVGEDSLFQCIREVRTALGDEQRQIIKLVSGRGYMFTAAVVVMDDRCPSEQTRDEPDAAAEAEAVPTPVRSFWHPLRPTPVTLGVLLGLCVIVAIALVASTIRADLMSPRLPLTVAVMPIVGASADRQEAAMAASVTDRLTDGLAKIDTLRVLTRRSSEAALGPEPASARPDQADVLIQGELEKGQEAWTLRARMIKRATGEIQTVETVSVDLGLDLQLQQSRLAAGVGDPLARRLNALLEPRGPPSSGQAKAAIAQALASINQTTRERFATAEAMLDKALADEPGNIDLEVTRAALQLRGIQMVWYGPEEARAAEIDAGATLERALRAKPNSIPVLETYCRFLSATNRFVESLVTCSRALSLNPWNGLALYLVGLGQIHLGRFEDSLATFRQADRFDTPHVSRWTWLLGAGWANMLLDRDGEALPWLQQSIAITPASGRSHMLLAAAYQRLGRIEEAQAALREGLRLRRGTTALNVSPPTKNASPVFIEASERIIRLMIAAGLPES